MRSHVVIQSHTRIGAGNLFFQFASIGEDPQDKKYQGEEAWLEIGDDNVFREGVTVHRGTGGRRRPDEHRQPQPAHGLCPCRP